MTAAVLTHTPALSKDLAELILDGAWKALDDKLTERADCVFCKGAMSGWCEECTDVNVALELIAGAKTQVRRCHSDRQAREIVIGLTGALTGTGRYGIASGTRIVTAGGAR